MGDQVPVCGEGRADVAGSVGIDCAGPLDGLLELARLVSRQGRRAAGDAIEGARQVVADRAGCAAQPEGAAAAAVAGGGRGCGGGEGRIRSSS